MLVSSGIYYNCLFPHFSHLSRVITCNFTRYFQTCWRSNYMKWTFELHYLSHSVNTTHFLIKSLISNYKLLISLNLSIFLPHHMYCVLLMLPSQVARQISVFQWALSCGGDAFFIWPFALPTSSDQVDLEWLMTCHRRIRKVSNNLATWMPNEHEISPNSESFLTFVKLKIRDRPRDCSPCCRPLPACPSPPASAASAWRRTSAAACCS